jgi:hypothetical protein
MVKEFCKIIAFRMARIAECFSNMNYANNHSFPPSLPPPHSYPKSLTEESCRAAEGELEHTPWCYRGSDCRCDERRLHSTPSGSGDDSGSEQSSDEDEENLPPTLSQIQDHFSTEGVVTSQSQLPTLPNSSVLTRDAELQQDQQQQQQWLREWDEEVSRAAAEKEEEKRQQTSLHHQQEREEAYELQLQQEQQQREFEEQQQREFEEQQQQQRQEETSVTRRPTQQQQQQQQEGQEGTSVAEELSQLGDQLGTPVTQEHSQSDQLPREPEQATPEEYVLWQAENYDLLERRFFERNFGPGAYERFQEF